MELEPTVRVRYFAVLRDRTGAAEESWPYAGQTVGELILQIVEARSLGLPPALIRAARGDRFLESQERLEPGDEVVLIPPVAGG